jgi:cold shock CspA family protein
MSSTATIYGNCARWDARGWGIIWAREGQNFFVHVSAVTDGAPLPPGEIVEFQSVAGPHGPRAVRVTRLGRQCPKCGGAPRAGTGECADCEFRRL